MNNNEKMKVVQFVGDKIMSDAVYNIILKSFLKRSNSDDVNLKAAERIAIDLLNDGWKELGNVRLQEQKKEKDNGQVGL